MSSAEILIRPERPDHPQVRALLAELDAYLASLYEPEANHILGVEALLAPEIDFLVAERAGQLVGCGATRRMPGETDTAGEAYGEIKRMFVDPLARGRNVARMLMEALENKATERKLTALRLETGIYQPEAIGLYRKFGYTEIGPFGGYEPDPLSLFMEKTL